ncbi:MAG: helix-turn-helix domain-containing protein [Gammaproteobacteria bacterium]|nr:helix-turn-helix domain-containing protein [Gammaproteobacteria bacterium]
MKHNELKAKALSNPETQSAYDALETEFALLEQMLRARKKAGLTQAEIAKRMGTKAPAVTRLESSLTSGKHSPSLVTLQKYANALGYKIQVKLVKSQDVVA